MVRDTGGDPAVATQLVNALGSDARCCVFCGTAQRRTTAFAAARALVGGMLGARSSSSDGYFHDALVSAKIDAADRKTLETLFIAEKSQPRQRPGDNTQTQTARALVNTFLVLVLGRPTVLLIEDDTELTSLMSDYFTQHGFQIDAVHDGRSGLARARRGTGGVINGKLYITGGSITVPGSTDNPVVVYDPITDSWSVAAAKPTPSESGSAAAVGGLSRARRHLAPRRSALQGDYLAGL